MIPCSPVQDPVPVDVVDRQGDVGVHGPAGPDVTREAATSHVLPDGRDHAAEFFQNLPSTSFYVFGQCLARFNFYLVPRVFV